jgi:hypothetical protein
MFPDHALHRPFPKGLGLQLPLPISLTEKALAKLLCLGTQGQIKAGKYTLSME